VPATVRGLRLEVGEERVRGLLPLEVGGNKEKEAKKIRDCGCRPILTFKSSIFLFSFPAPNL